MMMIYGLNHFASFFYFLDTNPSFDFVYAITYFKSENSSFPSFLYLRLPLPKFIYFFFVMAFPIFT